MYIRRSTDMQEASLNDQRKAIQEYAQHNKFNILREFCDDAISGKTVEARPSFQSMLEFARNNKGSECTLLVYDVSRFGRFDNPKEATYWEFELERNGIKVHYVTEGFSNDGSLGTYITKVVKDAEASEYIKKLSKLTKRGIQSCAERGYWTASQAPYGYVRAVIDPKTGGIELILKPGERRAIRGNRIKLVPDNSEKVTILKKIFDLYCNHEQGLFSIADYLNRNNIPNPSGKLYWHKSTLHNILRNPVYTGVISLNKGKLTEVTSEKAHAALIDKELFEKAQQRLKINGFGRRGGHTTAYMLTALVKCEQCGNNLHGATDNTKQRKGYRCSGYTCKGKSVCSSPYYPAELLENPVLDYINSHTSSPDWKQILQQGLNHALREDEDGLVARLTTSKKDYEQNKTRIKNLLGAIADGLPRETAIKAVHELEKTQENLEQIINQAEAKKHEGTQYRYEADQLYHLGIEFDTRFPLLTPQEKKKLIKTFLAKATINHTAAIITYQFYSVPLIGTATKPPETKTTPIVITRKRKGERPGSSTKN